MTTPFDPQPCATDAVLEADPVATTGLCLADGTPIAVVVHRDVLGTVTQDGWINLTTGTFTAGNPPVGTVACGDSRSVQVSGIFCDVDVNGDVLALVLIEYSYNPDGTINSVRLVDATTGTTYVPAGTITTCPEGTPQPEQDLEILCDVNAGVPTPFIRDYRRDELGAIVAVSNYTLAGAAYVPTGVVSLCGDTASVRDEELLVLCDATPTRFLRRYNYDAATGALLGIVNTTLDGSTPFVPVGAVGVCTSDDTPRTLSAQARVLTNATPWTPGADVVGVLTSVTVTGTSGLWDMVDQNGTALIGLPAGLSLTWNAEDDNTLTGPTSVTPQVGATVVANWTQR